MSTASWSATDQHGGSNVDADEQLMLNYQFRSILSIYYRRGRLGLAILEKDTPMTIRLMYEQPELSGWPTIESCSLYIFYIYSSSILPYYYHSAI